MPKSAVSRNPLYRIVSLEGFLWLLTSHTERYANPIDMWSDTYEGSLLHYFDRTDGRVRLMRELLGRYETREAAVRNYAKLERARYLCYGQCWSRERDSDAMWRIYSFGDKAIQLVSDVSHIKAMIRTSGEHAEWSCDIRRVNYEKDITSPDLWQKILRKGAKTSDSFFYKRDAFKHEQEVRVILNNSKDYTSYTDFASQMLRNAAIHDEDDSDVAERVVDAENKLISKSPDTWRGGLYGELEREIHVRVASLTDYVLGVRVHPMAAKWYVDVVGSLCEREGVTFLGKSDLYGPMPRLD